MKKVFLRRLAIVISIALIIGGPVFAGGEGEGGSEEAARIGEYPRAESLVLYMHGRNPNPEQMNMYLPGNAYGWLGNVGGHNTLWQVNTDKGTTDFWLATGYKYGSDYKSLTIFLREDATWSDGEAFDASDVVFTFETLLENSTMSYAAAVIEWVTNVSAVDKYTVRLDFKDVNPRFTLSIFSAWGMSILPEHVWKNENPLEFTNWPPVHTGPYKIAKQGTEEMVMQRIDDWWGNDVFGKPAPKYVIWRYLSPEARIIEMAGHRLDAAYLGGPTDYFEVKRKNEYAMAWYKDEPYAWVDPCPRYMVVNMRKKPFDNVAVRRAMSLAIDRQKVINVAYEGFSFVNNLMVPLYAYHEDFKNAVQDQVDKYTPTEYNVAKAIAILDEAGFTKGKDGIYVSPEGDRVSLTAITGAWVPELLRYGQVAVDAWNRIGIEAVAKPQEGGGFNDPWALKTFEAITGWMCQSWYDPYFMFEKYHSKYNVPEGDRTGSNDAGYANPELDVIIDELANLPYDMSNPRIEKLYHDAMGYLLRDVVFIPMSQSMFTLAQDSYYWEGWADADNPFATTGQWVPLFTWNILAIKSTGRK